MSQINKVLFLLSKRFNKKCYCKDGEGTYYVYGKRGYERCAWCKARDIMGEYAISKSEAAE